MDEIKYSIAIKIAESLEMDKEQIMQMIEIPPDSKMGDYAFPCFKLAKELRKSPMIIAQELKDKLDLGEIASKIEVAGGYVNIYVNREYIAKKVLKCIKEKGEEYGSSNEGNGKNITIDYSAPNLAKPFHIGHLRSTVIGGSLYNIYKFLGYNVIGINHIGDWGTQFGLLIAGYKRWGDDEKIKQNPIKELVDIYVRINKLKGEDETVTDEAREWFKKLEDGDSEVVRLWEWFREVSIEGFKKVYDMLGSKFDSWNGEAFYNDKTQEVVDILTEKNLLKDSEGAKIVDLSEYDMPPCIVLKSNGTTIYATRDLAAVLYRLRTYDFAKNIYVTSYEQMLHFKQVFKTVELMGYKEYTDRCIHVPFGMVHLSTGKMSTRQGNVVYLEDLLNETISKVKDVIEHKNPDLEDKDEIAKIVGIGAVIFDDLKNNRIKDIIFDINDMIKFEGETGPYVQYVYVRTQSILRKANATIDFNNINYNYLQDDNTLEVLKLLNKYNEIVENAANQNEPSIIARYVIDLAQSFSRLYASKQMIVDNKEEQNSNLAVVYAVGIVIKSALKLLCVNCPERM